MKVRMFLILFTVFALPAFSDDLFGFQYSLEVGTVQNNLFRLYDNEGLAETANLGTNWYVDLMLRLFLWKFFVSGRTQGYMYLYYTVPEKWAFEASIGFFPWDFLSVEVGWNYNRIWELAVPATYSSSYHNIFLRVTGKIGNVK